MFYVTASKNLSPHCHVILSKAKDLITMFEILRPNGLRMTILINDITVLFEKKLHFLIFELQSHLAAVFSYKI